MKFYNFVPINSLILLLLIIPQQIVANEIQNDQKCHPIASVYPDNSIHQNRNTVQTSNSSDNTNMQENLLPKNTGYYILGILAIGLAVTVVVVLNNASKGYKMPDP